MMVNFAVFLEATGRQVVTCNGVRFASSAAPKSMLGST